MATALHPTIARWCSDEHTLGMITFLESRPLAEQALGPVPPGVHGIGLCEADVLCVNDDSGELLVLDHEIDGRVLCAVAVSQASFLRAAGLLREHFARCAALDGYRQDPHAVQATARACATAAGGDRYESFYHMMLGA